MSKTITYLHVRAINACSSVGRLHVGQLVFPCILGRLGRTHIKREGDAKSPSGRWRLDRCFLRSDRESRSKINLPVAVLRPNNGWCDAPADRNYNRAVTLPYGARHEDLWRADHAYDVLVITDHNQRPRVKGAGSAIFLHMITPGSRFTAGCIALKPADLRRVLSLCRRPAYLVI